MPQHIRNPLGRSPTHPMRFIVVAMSMLACQQEPITAPCCAIVRVTLSTSGLSLAVGDSGSVLAWTVDSKGQVVAATPDWMSADLTIATVGRKDGLVTAISPGNTTVSATVGTLSATATVSVHPWATPFSLAISPAALNVLTGTVQRLTAMAFDSVGRPTSGSFDWSSADPTIATIGQRDGVVTAIRVGKTKLTVVVGGVSATAEVTVITPGPFTFTRTTFLGPGKFSSDVLSYSEGGLVSLRASQFSSIATAAWSPDASQLAVEAIYEWVDLEGYYVYTSDLFVRDVSAPAASASRALTTNGFSTSPSWSPDGRRIAYLVRNGFYGYQTLQITDVAGGKTVVLPLPPGWYGKPCWSPVGTRLALSGSDDGPNLVFVVNADGSGWYALSTPTADYDPCWSPDGTRLVFVRFRKDSSGEFYDVSTRDPDGGDVTRLASFAQFPSSPVWSPDGRQILFASADAVYAMNADGSGVVQLTSPPRSSWDGLPAWRR